MARIRNIRFVPIASATGETVLIRAFRQKKGFSHMDIDLILPLCIFIGILSYGLIAKWYVMPHLSNRPLNEALIPLIFPHCFRYIGMAFLIPGVTSEPLDSRFAGGSVSNTGDYRPEIIMEKSSTACMALSHRRDTGFAECHIPVLKVY
jgi:hypothetical protein